MRIGPGRDAAAFTAMWAEVASLGRDRRRGGYSRHWFDDGDRSMRAWFAEQATRRGLRVEVDRNTNLWAWWGEPGPGTVATGSHLDSVPGGGTFDGPLGVAAAFLAIDELRERGHQPTRPIAVVGFAEEEGGRFGLPCVGSRLLTGEADPDHVRRLRDAAGVSVAEAATQAGFDPQLFGPDLERIGRLDAFVELHLEHGRAMLAADANAVLALASRIAAHGRWRLTFSGQGNHAGTTPAGERRDPVVAAAATVVAARALMSLHAPAVATVGRLEAHPGGTNVIAASADLWLDARADTAAETSALVDAIAAVARHEAELEGCTLLIRRESFSDEVIFDPVLGMELTDLLGVPSIATGAGHDAGVLTGRVATAMLFVRNPSGVSHSPAEHADTVDCVAGVQALAAALESLSRSLTPDRGSA